MIHPDLAEYIHTLEAVQRAHGRTNSMERFVMEHGRVVPVSFDLDGTGLERGPMRHCFHNAQDIIIDAVLDEHNAERFTYMEGYACESIIPCHHGWVWDHEREVALELTWDDATRMYQHTRMDAGAYHLYIGVPFDRMWIYRRAMAIDGTGAVLGNWDIDAARYDPLQNGDTVGRWEYWGPEIGVPGWTGTEIAVIKTGLVGGFSGDQK